MELLLSYRVSRPPDRAATHVRAKYSIVRVDLLTGSGVPEPHVAVSACWLHAELCKPGIPGLLHEWVSYWNKPICLRPGYLVMRPRHKIKDAKSMVVAMYGSTAVLATDKALDQMLVRYTSLGDLRAVRPVQFKT